MDYVIIAVVCVLAGFLGGYFVAKRRYKLSEDDQYNLWTVTKKHIYD